MGRPGRSVSQVEKSPRLNWATLFLTVAYDSAFSPNVSIRWRDFPSVPCLAVKKLDDNSRLVVEIARVAWHPFVQPL